MQLLDSKFRGYWVLVTVMLSLTKVLVNMRVVGSCVSMQLFGQQVLGLLGAGDSVVGGGGHVDCGWYIDAG